MVEPSTPCCNDKLCNEIRPAGRDAKLFNDKLFKQLRRIASVPDDFVNTGWNLESLESGGGKGGCRMAFLGSEYIVKELSSSDHHTLLSIAASYVEHVRDGDTLLGAILLHFKDTSTGRKFYVMRNVLGSGPFLAKYDLKGCNDDKTLELFGEKVGTPGKWAAARVELVVTEQQHHAVMGKMQRDTQWLASNHLMDYSLIVGVKTGSTGFVEASIGQLGRFPLVWGCSDGSEVAVCIGIIDFLQCWSLKKMVARLIKCLECNKATIPPTAYARRFCNHFGEHFITANHVEEDNATSDKVQEVAASQA